MAVAETVERKTFYSTAAHLQLHVNNGQQVMKNGAVEQHGEKLVEFAPLALGNGATFGVLSTNDPEVIEYVERQMATGRNDLLTAEQYLERSLSPEEKLSIERKAHRETERKLEESNRLLAAMNAMEQRHKQQIADQQKAK